MSTEYNLAATLKLVDAAFDLEGLNDSCFIRFRPVYDLLTEGDRKSVRMRRLVEHAERKGQLAKLLTLIQEENPGQYEHFTSQLSREGAAPDHAGQRAGTQFNLAGDLTTHSSPPELKPSDIEQ